MPSIDCFMPKPIPVPATELHALVDTMEGLRSLVPGTIPAEESKNLSGFIEAAQIAVQGGYVNRGMLGLFVPFGQQVMEDNQFIPWVKLHTSVAVWLPWAEFRLIGGFLDDIDEAALAVERATEKLPILAESYVGLKRLNYHEDLEPSVSAWCVYDQKLGFCIFAMRESQDVIALGKSRELGQLELLPVKAVLELGWCLRKGYIVTSDSLSIEDACSGKYIEHDSN